MNFKTTLVMLIALVAVGLFLLLRGGANEEPNLHRGVRKLIMVQPEDVTKITVTSSNGETISMSKAADGTWSMTLPVTAAAQKFEADNLVREVANLETRGAVDATPATGLDKPRYTVKIDAKDKSHELAVGDVTSVGENLYVRLDGAAKAEVVAASLVAQLSKPASTYREQRLAPETADKIEQLSITRNKQTISLKKSDGTWTITAPTSMPADSTAVNDVLYAVTGLRAEQFVAENPKPDELGTSRIAIEYSTTPASTQPTTAPVAGKTVTIGQFSDISKKNVLATSSELKALVTIPVTALASLEKTPLDLRDRQILSLDAEKVNTVELTTDSAATTQPMTKPAIKTSVTVSRRSAPALEPIGPMPVTTGPATTQAATTQPVVTPPATKPASKWIVASAASEPANDLDVEALLATVSTLRAEKYLENLPLVIKPERTYTLVLTVNPSGPSLGERHELKVYDFGESAAAVGAYNGLTFEVNRSLLSNLAAKMTGE
jgi:hypothetical protein